MKKKVLSIMLTAIFTMSVFAGCTSNTSSSSGNTPATPSGPVASTEAKGESIRYDAKKFISVFASSPGGGMYNMAAAISPIWDEKVNVTASIGPGGSYSNFIAVSKGQADIGFSHQSMHYWAERAEGPFKEKIEGLSTISTLFPATVQAFTTAKNTSIQNVSDISDKRIGLGPQGSALNIFVLDYLKTIYNVTPETIAANGGTVSYMSDGDMSSALSDGIIDIGFGLGTYPKSSIQEIENSPGVRLIPFGDDLQKYLDINKGWDNFTIPANTYAGQTKEYPTVTSWAVMTVSDSMDEELVYRLTKAFWENRDKAAESCFEIKEFMKLETATAAMGGAPLHPGAARYYKEVGIIK
ncbi:MAG: TAXI family TRAP transporter solute-binding subunit [Clostridia bacterium]